MKKILLFSVLLAALAWCQTVYGMGRILVYKGTIKASKSIFDVNDTNNFTSKTIQGYWVVEVAPVDYRYSRALPERPGNGFGSD